MAAGGASVARLRAARQVAVPVAATVVALGGVLVSGAELDSNSALHAGAHTDRGGTTHSGARQPSVV